MKSAEEFATEAKNAICWFNVEGQCSCECERACEKLLEFARAIQSDAIRAAAEKCASLSNGEHRLHPAVEWSKMAKQTQEIAHWAFQNAAAEILSLLPEE